MRLIERQVIKPNHRFYPEADRLSLPPKKLDNCDNYIYRQNFLPHQPNNSLSVGRELKKSVNNKALSESGDRKRVHLNPIKTKDSSRQFISENQRFTAEMLRSCKYVYKNEMNPQKTLFGYKRKNGLTTIVSHLPVRARSPN